MQNKSSRRAVLSALSGGLAICAFNAVTRRFITAAYAEPWMESVPALDGELVTDPDVLASFGEDFGHLRTGVPVAVLRPGSYEDIVAAVCFARRLCIPLAMRGNGHSNFGQALSEAGIAIDSRTLNTIHHIDDERAVVDAGVLWRELLAAGSACDSTPPVLTDYLDLTVGGTLSMGGIGGGTSRHGLQLDQVESLTVVTGGGELLDCSPQQRPRLFHAVVGGGGQCAIIVRATVRMTTRLSQALQFNLYYDDLATYQADQEFLLEDGRFDYLEGQVVLGEDGSPPRFMIEVAKYHAEDDLPDVDALLAGLSDERAQAEENWTTYDAWSARLDPLVALLKDIGLWGVPHPWLNLFIPSSQLTTFMGPFLSQLSPAETGGGAVLLYPVATHLIQAPLFRLPAEPIAWSLSMLRFAADPSLASAMIQSNRTLYEDNVSLGGTRYTIGAIPMDSSDWRNHYGAAYRPFRRAKRDFDPDKILAPGQGIF